MPWHVEKRGDEWCVIKDADGKSAGCHASETKAKRQLRALYASENQGGTMKTPEFVSWGMELSKVELHSKGDGRTMVGYASAFDYPIPGDNGETIFLRFGAFTKTLKEHTPVAWYSHGMDPQIAEKPLGKVVVAQQDKTGLWTETKLAATDYNENVIIPLLKDGTLNAMSIGFVAMQESWSGDHSERSIEQVALRDFGPTPMPRNLGATAALHSRSILLDPSNGSGSMNGEKEQAEASGREDRESILDPDRLTWDVNATALLQRWELEQREMEERIARL
jgi:HK97 family phage prohead protease